MLTLAALVGDRIYDRVNDARDQPNGHAEVRPQDAHLFWDLQQSIKADTEGNEEKLDEILRLLRK